MDESKQLTVILCPSCDFASGRRGMDRCRACDGTGSGFFVRGRFYPNTEAGFKAASERHGDRAPLKTIIITKAERQ